MLDAHYLVWLVVFLALAFDYINGFHDTANAIATSVSTRAIEPKKAIMMTAALNFLGAMVSTGVAKTIGGDIVMSPSLIDSGIISAALIGAITWNLLTWYWGIPSSSSHALIGGIIGAVGWSVGFDALNEAGILKIFLSLILSPIVAMIGGYIVMKVLLLIFGRLDVPIWVKLCCATAMAMGTAVGGWKIISTMGTKIFKLETINGFAADLNSAITIFTATFLHLPVSTTHVVSGSLLGVGSSKRIKAVNWGVARSMVMAWFVTIPLSGIVAAIAYEVGHLLFG